MRVDYSSAMEPESEAAIRLESTTGILIDEFTMLDRRAWNRMRKNCQEYPLREDLRKAGALPDFGYRDLILCGDVFQLPPASGHPPLVTHRDFQEKLEFFVLRENRRQEKNPEYGKLLDIVKEGGGVKFAGSNASVYEGNVDESVRSFFVRAYARGWNVCRRNVDFEQGVAMTSYRRHRDIWNDAVVSQMEKEDEDCDKVDVACFYDSPHGQVDFDMTNEDHQRNKQQYPKVLKLRTSVRHQCRLMLLRNLDVSEGLTNGTTLRLLPRSSWSGTIGKRQQGRQDENLRWKVRQVSLQREGDFTILTEKDDSKRAATRVHIKGGNVHVIGVSKEDTLDVYGLGSVNALPVCLACACTVHKCQGLTIPVVLAILEGLFAHGQVYVQTSRTPEEMDFKCVGVPPEDIIEEVIDEVLGRRRYLQRLLKALDENKDIDAVVSVGTGSIEDDERKVDDRDLAEILREYATPEGQEAWGNTIARN